VDVEIDREIATELARARPSRSAGSKVQWVAAATGQRPPELRACESRAFRLCGGSPL